MDVEPRPQELHHDDHAGQSWHRSVTALGKLTHETGRRPLLAPYSWVLGGTEADGASDLRLSLTKELKWSKGGERRRFAEVFHEYVLLGWPLWGR